MKKHLFVLLSLFFFVLFSHAQSSTTDSLLRIYDYEIGHAQQYLDQRRACIDSLSLQPVSARQLLQLAELYRPYQSDSATVSLFRIMDMYPEYADEARVKLLFLFSSIGSFVEALDMADQIHCVPDSLRLMYFEAMNRLYIWGANNLKTPQKRAQFTAIGLQYLDSMNQEAMLRPDEPISINAKIMRYHGQGNYKAALRASDSIFAIISEDTHDYALYAYQRYLILQDMQQHDQALQWLIRSAITDVRCAVTDNGASWVLAKQLYLQGAQQRANNYIDYSLSNAAFYNAPIRFGQISNLAHTITKAYQHQQETLSRNLRWALLSVIAILILLIAVAIYAIHQSRALQRLARKQQKINAQLEALNDKQQQHIGHFLTVYSKYIQRLSRMAHRAGERDTDIFFRQEMLKFYDTFDDTILSIYPDFVRQFNELLTDEGKITPPIDGKLTTELRIYACVCLGIDNVTQIAELLCYSISTIYNYRVRIKNSAIGDRDTFENRVRQICPRPMH